MRLLTSSPTMHDQLMRIAYVTADPGVPVFGRKGCSVHVQEVLRAMARATDAEIDLFATSCAGSSPVGLEGVRVHPLPPAPKGDLASREQRCLAANDAVREALEAEGPFAFVYERYSLWSFAAMEYARSSRVPGLLEVNAPLIAEQAEHRGLVDRAGAEQATRRALKSATALLAVSEEIAEFLEGYVEAQRKVHLAPNGVDPSRFQKDCVASMPAAAGTFTVGFVGSMKPWHGVGTLVEAFALLRARCPESRLLLVGDGPGRQQLAAEAARRGLEKPVQFTGAVAPEAVPGLLASMDVAVAPYPRLANFYFSPLKLYEYMAAGLPVVASRIGQPQRVLEHEATGLLVEPDSAVALAGALERLRSDADLRARLGSAARAKVLSEHTWDATVRTILRLAGLAQTRMTNDE